MPQYVLNRNFSLSTVNGGITFKKGEPTGVPHYMERDVQLIGAERVDGEAPSLIASEPTLKTEVSGDDRKAQLFAAFELIAEKNDAKDFTGQGVPSVKAVEKIVDFTPDRAEINEGWSEYRISKAEQQ